MAFTETKLYDPYGKDTATRTRMEKAFGDRDYTVAAAAAEEVLKTNFVDVRAQMVAALVRTFDSAAASRPSARSAAPAAWSS